MPMSAVCGRCGKVYWVDQGYACSGRTSPVNVSAPGWLDPGALGANPDRKVAPMLTVPQPAPAVVPALLCLLLAQLAQYIACLSAAVAYATRAPVPAPRAGSHLSVVA